MRDRIAKIIEQEQLTNAGFAEEIGVQASSISHVLSGRNNPSIDFVIKILERFRGINSEWLLLGKGEMYKSVYYQAENIQENKEPNDLFSQKTPETPVNEPIKQQTYIPDLNNNTEIEKIVMFFTDGSFKIYNQRD
ncbi:MAG: helix-turn-helix transcriptional regulator [Bacteroidales bacterium]|nr:helix-turn-helix transcriptional regulator [Bacteroidales bacterium]